MDCTVHGVGKRQARLSDFHSLHSLRWGLKESGTTERLSLTSLPQVIFESQHFPSSTASVSSAIIITACASRGYWRLAAAGVAGITVWDTGWWALSQASLHLKGEGWGEPRLWVHIPCHAYV